MTSIAQKILRSFKKKDRILHEISEEDIERSKKIKAQAKYIQSLEAQISKRQAQDRLKKVKEIDTNEEIDLIKQLEKKEEELKLKKLKNAFDLSKLFKKLENKKFRDRFEIADKDDKAVFDKFKTFLILDNGNIAIQGKSGEVWADGSTLRQVIHKPESIKNQIRRGRLLLPFDENFKTIPDFENLEMPEMSYNEEEDNWNISEERIKKVKEMIMERDYLITELREDKEKNEQTIADMRNKIQDQSLAINNWKKQTENSQAELSIAMKNDKEMSKKFYQMDRDLSVSQEQKLLSDDIKEKYDTALKSVLNELEDEKSRTAIRKAMQQVWNDIREARKMIPKIEIKQEEVKEPQKIK